MSNVQRFDLSSSEHTPAGHLLFCLWYGRILEELLDKDEYAGCPNNGMRHDLVLILSWEDLRAFLNLVEERMAKSPKCLEGLKYLRERATGQYVMANFKLNP